MRTSNNLNSNARDSAAQIDEGAEAEKCCINNDLFHVEPLDVSETFKKTWAKRDAVLAGALKEQAKWPGLAHEFAAQELAYLVAQLTAPEKAYRDEGKKRMRELVKLGKEKA